MIAAVPVRACSVCKQLFERRSTMHVVCSYPCTVKLNAAKARQEKLAFELDKRETRAKLAALKPRSKWLSEAQAAFNAFIRARDAREPCISCGKAPDAPGSWDAGHYLTVGARPELRFNESNCRRQCVKCNQHLHGNLVLYRVELVKRIGLAAVEKLEGPHPPMHYNMDDLRIIKHTYRQRARELKAQQENAMAVSAQVSAEVSK